MSETPSSQAVPAASNAAGTSTRRSVLRAAAWTTPVIATAVAAPAFAASQDKYGLNGWVYVKWSSKWEQFKNKKGKLEWRLREYLTLDGRGEEPNIGLWVSETKPGDVISNVSIVFYTSVTESLTWTALSGNSGAWSTPTAEPVTTLNGVSVRPYRTTYLSPITATSPTTTLNNDLVFQTTGSGVASAKVWALRSVSVNGKQITRLRGPVSPGNPAPESPESRSDFRAAEAQDSRQAPQEEAAVESSATL